MQTCPKCGSKLTTAISAAGKKSKCMCGYSHHEHPHNSAVKVIRSVHEKEDVDYPTGSLVTIVMFLGLLAVFLAILFL